MNCKHIFIGTSEGVHCKLCGLSMTDKEYTAYIAPKEPKKATTTTKAKKEA